MEARSAPAGGVPLRLAPIRGSAARILMRP